MSEKLVAVLSNYLMPGSITRATAREAALILETRVLLLSQTYVWQQFLKTETYTAQTW